MIIVRIMEGLGNQLFQYAMGRALALRHQTRLKLDTAWYSGKRWPPSLNQFPRRFLLDAFCADCTSATPSEVNARCGFPHGNGLLSRKLRDLRYCAGLNPKSYVCEHRHIANGDSLSVPSEAYLNGFWQNPALFSDASDAIRADFRFRSPELIERGRAAVESHRGAAGTVIGVHVRRGDLAHMHARRSCRPFAYGPLQPAAYFAEAARLFPDTASFIVVSDSNTPTEWCREALPGRRVAACTLGDELGDFALLRSCDHLIISNSTFGWWAAWLNDRPGRSVVAPRAWFYGATNDRRRDALVPADWHVR